MRETPATSNEGLHAISELYGKVVWHRGNLRRIRRSCQAVFADLNPVGLRKGVSVANPACKRIKS